MHELSLAGEVIRIAESEAVRNKAKSVSEITVEIGTLAGIEIDSFESALGILASGSMLEKARLKIQRIRGTGICPECGKEFGMSQRLDLCPECKILPIEIKGGHEFRVVSIVIEEE